MFNDRALLFLPDISGFTQFVDRTAIEHGEHIISELIELLIAEDTLGLTVAEVEGDAIFFYSTREMPSLAAMVDQCRRMFLRFHGHLRSYTHMRICDCGACSTADKLGLKFVAHAGPIRALTVQGHPKPYGKDVILAHRLLKNDVPGHEYMLFTETVRNAGDADLPIGFATLSNGRTEYPDLTMVDYTAYDLSPLHKEVHVRRAPMRPVLEAKDPVLLSVEIAAPLTKVYAHLIDLDQRALWDSFAKRIDRPDHFVNRPGSQHTCVLPMGSMELETVSAKRAADRYEYVERLLDVPFVSEAHIKYLLLPAPNGTRLITETHVVPTTLAGRLMLPMVRRRLKRWVTGSLDRLRLLITEQTPTKAEDPQGFTTHKPTQHITTS